jgi:t-SNARE complex subunit (syntaxin)
LVAILKAPDILANKLQLFFVYQVKGGLAVCQNSENGAPLQETTTATQKEPRNESHGTGAMEEKQEASHKVIITFIITFIIIFIIIFITTFIITFITGWSW